MNKEHQKYIKDNFSEISFINEPMKKHSTFGIGGNAKVFILPQKLIEIKNILKYSTKYDIKVIFTGSGSNLLVSDRGFDGIIISLKKTFKKLLFLDDGYIVVESGVMLGNMVKEAIKRNIEGFESLVGVPGTVGGALYMNAGAYGTEISKYFVSARVVNKKGKEKTLTKSDIQFFYRKSTFSKDDLLIEAKLKYKKGDIKKIEKMKKKFSDSRKNNQPLKFRSAGSIFKNPSTEVAAGYLIDKAGLKGLKKGNAMISPKHANFIVNLGKASSDDVLYLIRYIKREIAKEYKILLELEIKLIGFSENEIQGLGCHA